MYNHTKYFIPLPYTFTTMINVFLRFIGPLILVLETSAIFAYSFSNNVTDHQSLLSFKTAADPVGVLKSWNDSIHFCHWEGIACSRRRQRVTALVLPNYQLGGTLSPHIDNSFQGEFPANMSHCVDLESISATKNHLKGNLPAVLASWSKLKLNRLFLPDNQFTGSIPPSIENISSLRYLDLRKNNLEGFIPLEVAHLANLEDLLLGSNNLSGMVPLPIYNISSLRRFDLDDNNFGGKLPADLGSTLPNLQEFYIGLNRFWGSFPLSITNASNLFIFDMSYNHITGPLPMNFGSLSHLKIINLGGNPLGDNQPLSFINSLVNCTNLYALMLFQNGLRGEIPSSIVNLSRSTEILVLEENHMYGMIPSGIGNLVNMITLSLEYNSLSGTIPESIGELSKLGRLFLGENNISGVIPISFSNVSQLSILHLENNLFRGSIPTELFNISTLEQLYLAKNDLEGVIPEQIVGISSRCNHLDLNDNLFTGPLPSSIGTMKQLVYLDVSNNRLIRDIPATLGDCVMLEELYMGGNLFEGGIPYSFKPLRSLALLDLSNNSISGRIPDFFEGFHLIQFVNLSHNKLEGEVPKEGVFSNVSAFSVIGNSRLCGGIRALQLPACPEIVSKSKKRRYPLRTLFLIVLLPVVVLLTCLAFIRYRQRRSKQMNVHVPVLQESLYLRLSYQDLLQATNNFSPNNLLGVGRYGSVYKGVFESLEHTVAVKVLNIEVRGATKSFLAECETLRNIRHRNLIKIITACSSTDFNGNDFKALVFEFMTNGNLDNWLHLSPSGQGNGRNLTLLQRLNISIDVAQGLDYLHHHSHSSIIHCDIKPSNILLDEEFVARVGDFGLARFSFPARDDVKELMSSNSSNSVCGTVGYVPPEYGAGGKLSIKGDVYSYGILLLEIFTGKRPTCSSIIMDNCDNLHNYVKKAHPQRVIDIVDPKIVLDQEDRGLTASQSYNRVTAEEVCLTSIFEVGILCSKEIPRERIDMSTAIKRLNVARENYLQHITCVKYPYK
nr:PREDICTED: probable LRR receptor-like serine/threonine-protein kinase At3g47570 isoform X2 [Daucus carota subsp. sativus]